MSNESDSTEFPVDQQHPQTRGSLTRRTTLRTAGHLDKVKIDNFSSRGSQHLTN